LVFCIINLLVFLLL